MAKTAVDVEQNEAASETADLRAQIADLTETVQLLLKAQTQKPSGGMNTSDLEALMLRVAQVSAEAQERAANPSNKTHPGISVYSYPEGDRKRPRSFKVPMTWVGTRLDIDTTTAEEIELMNLAEPGVFPYRRTDGTLDLLTVTGDRDAAGKVTGLHFQFDHAREKRQSLPGIVPMLREALKVKTPEQLQLDVLQAELAQLRAAAR